VYLKPFENISMRFFARPLAELMDFKGFQQSVVTFLQAAN